MSNWGDQATQFFFELIPELVLDSIESAYNCRSTGRVFQLNSMENRVYEIELEEPHADLGRSIIAKFYRPGRWNRDQIEAEHNFLQELKHDEIPAVAPLVNDHGETLFEMSDQKIYFTAFPKVGGRSPDELENTEYQQVGRLIARLHNVGAVNPDAKRIRISPETFGTTNLKYLLENRHIPIEIKSAYKDCVNRILETAAPGFERSEYIRIHGDCHFGNLLKRDNVYFWVDFDDMLIGPAVQDLWLLLPGRDEWAQEKLRHFLMGYEQMRPFDDASLKLIEPLRALRLINFSAWIARRWEDPAFQRAFPLFKDNRYWHEQLNDLREIEHIVSGSSI